MAVHTQVLPVPTDTPYRLGRHVEHDDRSRDYEFSRRKLGPDRDQLWSFSQPVLNQMNTSSCVGNTITQFFNTDYAKPCRTLHQVDWYTEGFALNVYHLATVADGVSQDIYPPNDDGTSALGGAKAAQELGLVDTYTHAFDFDTFRAAIETQPVCVGTLWTNQMFTADPTGLIAVGDLGDVNDPNNPNIAGGHEYLALGISYTLQQVRFLTSWGPDFGIKGEFKMTFADFETLLDNQGDVLVLHGIGMK